MPDTAAGRGDCRDDELKVGVREEEVKEWMELGEWESLYWGSYELLRTSLVYLAATERCAKMAKNLVDVHIIS